MSSPFPTQNPNRASLLAGLRTGGVRPPQSAAPTAMSFDPQQLALPSQQQFSNRGFMTAAVDGPNNSFAAQQQGQLTPYHFQQAMHLEMLKMQAYQAQAQAQQQQQQLKLLRQQQAQQQQAQQQQAQAQQQRRASFQPPATAGPTGSFDLRSAALNAQMRRQPEQQKLSLQPNGSYDQAPMTARLDGKFGTRSTSMPLGNNNNGSNSTGTTTVISGGTSLGSMASNNAKETTAPSKSDSASSWRRGASSGNSALNAIRERNAASAKVAAPAADASPSTTATAAVTAPVSASKRPKPLSFTLSAQKPMIPEVLIDTSEAEEDDSSSNSSRSSAHAGSGKSSPTTSNELLSIGANESALPNPPLSPREEASKRLYEGLGLGRPRSRNSDSGELQAPPSPRTFSMNVQPPQTAGLFPSHDSGFTVNSSFPQSPFVLAPVPHTASLSGPNYSQHRLDRSANQPKRQPRGPPSNQEELVPLNFAARSPRLPPSTASLVGSMQSLAVEAY